MNRDFLISRLGEHLALKKAGNSLLKQSKESLVGLEISTCDWVIAPQDKTFGTVEFQAIAKGKFKKILLAVQFESNCCRFCYLSENVTKVDIYLIKKAFTKIGVDWFVFDIRASVPGGF